MARAHVEYVQSQNVAWGPTAAIGLRRGARAKHFGIDPETGAFTAIVEYAAGECSGPFTRAGSEEAFVLAVELAIGGRTLGYHHYAYVPAGTARTVTAGPAGARVLTFCNGGAADEPTDAPPTPDELLIVDAEAMPWDGTTLDPKLTHLRLSRKILRASDDDACRTYLLAGLPHGRPADGRLPVERHPHAEEMFLLSGTMTSPQGIMQPGAYFYRPAGIEHGPHFSDHGFFMFMRNPGTSRIQTEWLGEARPLAREPAFAPVLPPEVPPEWRRPWPASEAAF